MVEAVKNSTQVINAHTNIQPSGMAQAVSQPQEEIFGSPLMGYGSDMGLTDLNSRLDRSTVYGPVIGWSDRLYDATMQNAKDMGNQFEVKSVTADDRETLIPLSNRLDALRIAGIRYWDNDVVTNTLKGAMESGKGTALYITNCAEGGLKNPNLPDDIKYSFENLKDPLRLVNTLMESPVTAQQANENVDLLSEIALKEKSPELAACLLKETSSGGMLHWGTDFGTAKKLLIDSKDKFDSKADYNRFVTNVDQAYKKMFGESMDDHVYDNYKPEAQRYAPMALTGFGMLAGALKGMKYGKKGGLLGAAIGAVVGGVAGTAIHSLHCFGENEHGEELLATLDAARQKDHRVNTEKYMGFGSLSTTVPALG